LSELRLPPQIVGRRIRCLGCGASLAVRAADGPKRKPSLRLVPLAWTRLCPECATPMALVAQLDGRKIRCHSCSVELRVSISPCRLEIVGLPAAANGRNRLAEPQAAITAPAEPAQRAECEKGFELDEPVDVAAPAELSEAAGEGESNHASATPASDAPSVDASIADTALRTAISNLPQPAANPVRRRARRPEPARRYYRPALPIVDLLAIALGLALPVLKFAGLLLAVTTVLGLGWYWLQPAIHPQARYLPENCRTVSLLPWREANAWSMPESRTLPGGELLRRCRTLISNAGLAADDIERINAGDSGDGGELMIVYHLARPVEPQTIMKRPAFESIRKSEYYKKEIVRGVEVHLLGQTAIAFPEPQIMINGEVETVRAMVRSVGGRVDPAITALLDGLDGPAPAVAITSGVPASFAAEYLAGADHLKEAIRGTVDRYEYGPTVRFSRTLHLQQSTAASAGPIAEAVSARIAQAARRPKTPPALEKVMTAVRVKPQGETVTLKLEVDSRLLNRAALSAAGLELLGKLF
jgi:hypothetical protein